VNAKYVVGLVVIIAFGIWGTSSFFKSTVQYVSIAEAAKSDRTIQVMGKIDFDQVRYDQDDSQLEFVIYDAEAESKGTADHLKVVYSGTVPGNFEQATSVVLKGQSNDDGDFEASQMLVKCPSKYQGDGSEYQDGDKHEGSGSESEGA